MCLIFLKTKGSKNYLTYERFLNALYHNPDSIGIAYKGRKNLCVKKFVGETLRNENELKKIYDEINSKDEFAIHFRFATHGKVDTKNCHPYYVDKDIWLMHNGILFEYESKEGNKSDTKNFIDKYLKPYMKDKDKNIIHSKKFKKQLGEIIGYGNKLLLFDNQFNWSIINEDCGKWIDGCWLSNVYSTESSIRSYKSQVANYPFDNFYEDEVVEDMSFEEFEKQRNIRHINYYYPKDPYDEFMQKIY